jgi:gamma-tubulin complex component 2
MIEDVYASTKGKEYMPVCDNDSFWENRYRINPNKTPVFLVPLQDKILNTGKFLSVIRECGKSLDKVSCFSDPLMYAVEDKVYQDRIDAAYQAASRQLLHLLLDECDLVGHLLSVKHFFFMDQGDVMVHFMDSAEDELSKDIEDTNPMRLSSLLELAVKTSVMKSDPHHELVQIQLLEESLLDQLSTIISMANDKHLVRQEVRSLKGFEAMTLIYEVKWPLTLILSQKSITCYQMLFRQLFMCKYVERQLHCVWKDNKVAKLYALKAVTGYAEAFALRQKMLNFVQNLSYFMTVEVIEPNFQSFLEKISSYTQLDHMSREHSNFVEGCLRDCMMTQEFALQYMMKLLNLCLSFSAFMQVSDTIDLCFPTCHVLISQENHKIALPYELQLDDERSSQEGHEANEVQFDSNLHFEDQIKTFHEEFNLTLMNFLQEIATQDDFTGNVYHILYR